MNLRQLRYFCQIADVRSLRKAAALLHIAQPALSRQVRLLEEETGCRLLERLKRGVALTEAGTYLYERAQALLRHADETKAELAAMAASPGGELRIAFPPALGSLLVGPVAAELREKYPRLGLELIDSLAASMNAMLLQDRIDLAITVLAEQNPLIMAMPFYDEDIWLIADPNLPLPEPQIEVDHLRELPLMVPAVTRQLLMVEHGLKLEPVVKLESVTVAATMLKARLGYFLGAPTWFRQSLARGDLHGAPVKGLEFRLCLATRADRPATQAMLRLIRALRDQACRIAEDPAGPSIRLPRQDIKAGRAG